MPSEPKSPQPAGGASASTRRRSSSVSNGHYKAVFVPVDGQFRDVLLPIISKFGSAQHTASIQKIFAKDKTEQDRASSYEPRTEAAVASSWKSHGWPRLTVIVDSNSAGNGMPRNIVATKILSGPEMAAAHRVLAVHGPALILAESEDESSETSLERDFTVEDLQKLLAAYEESALSTDTGSPAPMEETEESKA